MSLKKTIAAVLLSFQLSAVSWAASLEITPSTFDFGWCPDNSKITAEFTARNTTSDIIPLTAVKPACGCTAGEFTPGDLSSQEETKITLIFNTRGYAGYAFDKPAAIKTDKVEQEFTARVRGFVLNPSAKLVPGNDGVASFEPGSDKKQTIEILNKTDKPMPVVIIQKPAGWATVKLNAETIVPGKAAVATITVDGSTNEERTTSVTFEGKQGGDVHRMTLAIRTGPPPPPVRKPIPQAAPAPAAPAPKKS